MLNFMKLWILLENKGMKKTDLTKNKIISPATLAKLGKNETVTSDTIEKLCGFLDCQPGDIMEYINENQVKEVEEQLGVMTKAIGEQLKAVGVNEELFATMLSQAMNETMKNIFESGSKTIGEINQKVVDDMYDQIKNNTKNA